MSTKKPSYVGYSEEDVAIMEAHYFVLQFGGDFMSKGGTFLFTKKEIAKLYKRTLKNLMGVIVNGSDKDKKHAMQLMSELTIQPMRLH